MTLDDFDQSLSTQLSKRERQIMDALFEAGELTAQEVQATISDPPSYSTVRALLAKLVEKNIVSFREDGPRYVYFPVTTKEDARTSALQRLLKTFFNGSPSAAVNALLGMSKNQLNQQEIDALQKAIDAAAAEQASDNTSKKS
jgi:BlaI family transcriptional regulator, penicillinase repressor